MKQLDERQLIELWGERIEAAQIRTQLATERIASALEKIEKLCGPYPGESMDFGNDEEGGKRFQFFIDAIKEWSENSGLQTMRDRDTQRSLASFLTLASLKE